MGDGHCCGAETHSTITNPDSGESVNEFVPDTIVVSSKLCKPAELTYPWR